MHKHRIICVNHEHFHRHTEREHTHIVSVGTGNDPGRIERRWKVEEVVAAINAGEHFYTEGEESHKIAEVEKFHCGHCGRVFIKTKPDHVHDNNLDSLRQCPVIPDHPPTRDRDDRPPQPNRRHG